MSSISTSNAPYSSYELTHEQLQFLEEHWTVYDPDSGECFNDFSNLLKCKLVLLGETHYTHIMNRLQALFLKTFVPQKAPSALLLETLSSGQTIKASEIGHWKDLSDHLTIMGSDIRFNCTREEYIKWHNLEHELRTLNLSYKNHLIQHSRKIAEILRENFDSLVMGSNEFEINKETFEQIQAQSSIFSGSKEKMMQDKEQILKRRAECNLGFNEIESHVTSSNKGLGNEIIKNDSLYARMYSIWGKGHWYSGEKLFKQLRQAQVSYIVLIPNKKTEALIEEELSWRFANTSDFKITTIYKQSMDLSKGTYERLTFHTTLNDLCKDYFLPQIRKTFTNAIYKCPEPSPITFTKDDLSIFAKENQVYFPAHTKIKLVGVNQLAFEEIQGVLKKDQNAGIAISKVFNNMLMGVNKKISSCKIDKLNISADYENHNPVLIFSSPNSIQITLENNILCYADHLLSEMKRKGIKEFAIKPLSSLIFYYDGKNIESLNDFYNWLNEKTPDINYEVFITHPKNTLLNITKDLDSPQKLVSLNVAHDSGFSICLQKKSPPNSQENEQKEASKQHKEQ